MYNVQKKKKLILEDGSIYEGSGFGSDREAMGELAYNSSMVGYQEIISDPANAGLGLLMTYPLIGSYGVMDEDSEARTSSLEALVVHEYNDMPSNFRYSKTLAEYMEENAIPGISLPDTRTITVKLCSKGTMRFLLTDAETDSAAGLAKLLAFTPPVRCVEQISCKKRWYSRTANAQYNVLVLDCGVKLSTVRKLNELHCNVTVVPYDTPAEDILFTKCDGVVAAGGPGDPAALSVVTDTLKALRGKVPLFGTGLGCMLLAIACGAKTEKLKAGMRGGYPVQETGRGIASLTLNNGYGIAEADFAAVTHRAVGSGSIVGFTMNGEHTSAVAFEPIDFVFPGSDSSAAEAFLTAMKEAKTHA